MVFDVFDQKYERYLFCCEHIESIHGVAKASALEHSQTCAQVL
jgi:hypothetical protein